MKGLTLVAIGPLPEEVLPGLVPFLAEATRQPCTASGGRVDPSAAYDSSRGQYDCRRLLPALSELSRETGLRVLGVADIDLFSPIFTFVFGEAVLGGAAGLFSMHRLRPISYGLPGNPTLLEGRTRREALHETGHMLGLVHCRTPDCVMRFSGVVEEVDLKRDAFCPECDALLDGAPAPGAGSGIRPRSPGRGSP